MISVTSKPVRRVLIPLGWSAVVLGVGFYAAFALSMGVSEILYLIGAGPELKHRATPIVFVVHALAGTIALLIGPLQSVRWIRQHAAVRSALGRTYVVAVYLTCMSAAVDALSFGVSLVARLMFITIAAAWFTTTTIGMVDALAHRFSEQHEWMIRSYALALFFVTFSLWGPALAATSLPATVAYPLSQFLSAALNLGVAEIYIRRTRGIRRRRRSHKTALATRVPIRRGVAPTSGGRHAYESV